MALGDCQTMLHWLVYDVAYIHDAAVQERVEEGVLFSR
jgi:hypothetical protein